MSLCEFPAGHGRPLALGFRRSFAFDRLDEVDEFRIEECLRLFNKVIQAVLLVARLLTLRFHDAFDSLLQVLDLEQLRTNRVKFLEFAAETAQIPHDLEEFGLRLLLLEM